MQGSFLSLLLSLTALCFQVQVQDCYQGAGKRPGSEKKIRKKKEKNQRNRASAYICFCRLRAKSRI